MMSADTKMGKDKRDEANKATVEKLLGLQAAVEELTTKKKDEIQAKATKTFRDLTRMIWITFLFGLALVTTSLVLFIFFDRNLSVLGMGTLGVGDWLALFFYKPMDRLQQADKDYIQQMILLKSWAFCVNLEMVAMNANDSPSVTAASKNIERVGLAVAHALQGFPRTTPDGGQGSAKAGTAPPAKPA